MQSNPSHRVHSRNGKIVDMFMNNSKSKSDTGTETRAPWTAPEVHPFSLSEAENTSNTPNQDIPGSTFAS